MKKIILGSLIIIFSIFLISGIALADTEADMPEAGILPDSKLFTLELWWEDVQRFFTFDDVKKAELETKLAMKRMTEAEKLIEKGKTELAEKNLLRFQNRLEAAYEKAEQANEKGKDVEALLEKLEANSLRHQEVLSEVYEKIPDNAQESILKAMENSAQGLENAMENIQNSEDGAEEFKNKIKNNLENFGTKKKLEIKEKLQQRGVLDDNNVMEKDDSEDEPELESDADDDQSDDEVQNINENQN